MFDFFTNAKHKRAFTVALKEVEDEMLQKAPAHKQTKDVGVSRVYQATSDKSRSAVASDTQAMVQPVNKYKSNINKPETNYVDLKNFKDWRKVETVESSQPKYDEVMKSKLPPQNTARKPLFEDDDDLFTQTPTRKKSDDKINIRKFLEDLEKDLEPEKNILEVDTDNSADTSQDDVFDLITSRNKKATQTEAQKTKVDIVNNTKQEQKENKTQEMVNQFNKAKALHRAKNYEKFKESKERTLNAKREAEEKELMKRSIKSKPRNPQKPTATFASQKVEKVERVETPKPIQEQAPVKETPKIKVEVVAPDEDKVVKAPVKKVAITKVPVKKAPDQAKPEVKAEEPKKVTNRKPRGKSKKRFDADVITFVDWK